MAEGCHVVSRLFIGKVIQQQGTDSHFYDGFSISVRTDKADVPSVSAYLLDDESGSSVLIKVPKMPSVWAMGKLVSTVDAMKRDATVDRLSVLVDGKIPPYYILVRFPREKRLKNVFIPQQAGNRQIKKVLDLTEMGHDVLSRVTADPVVTLDATDHTVTTTIETLEVRNTHTNLQAVFCVANAAPIKRFSTIPVNDDVQAADNLYKQLSI